PTHVDPTAGDYTARVAETDKAGTSLTQVFTGQTVSRNGKPTAGTSRTFQIVEPTTGRPPIVYVANYGDGTVTPIVSPSNVAGEPIPEHANPGALAITPGGFTLLAANPGANSVTPIDTKFDQSATPTVVGNEPSAIAVT